MPIFGIVVAVLVLGALGLYIHDRTQTTHSILRRYPILGRVRYLSEQVGHEFRQYWFQSDNEGKPFSRNDFKTVVLASKYLSTLIGFGSERVVENLQQLSVRMEKVAWLKAQGLGHTRRL